MWCGSWFNVVIVGDVGVYGLCNVDYIFDLLWWGFCMSCVMVVVGVVGVLFGVGLVLIGMIDLCCIFGFFDIVGDFDFILVWVLVLVLLVSVVG